MGIAGAAPNLSKLDYSADDLPRSNLESRYTFAFPTKRGSTRLYVSRTALLQNTKVNLTRLEKNVL
jgi:hypothetical protein